MAEPMRVQCVQKTAGGSVKCRAALRSLFPLRSAVGRRRGASGSEPARLGLTGALELQRARGGSSAGGQIIP